jgi:DNA-binding HxlR family transcriptional regulator
MARRKEDEQYGCAIEVALDVIGGKWKGIVIYRLLDGTARFNDLRRLMPTVTHRVLTRQLRELEKDGVIRRTVYATVPPKVEYDLTEFGATLKPIFDMMNEWGLRYRRAADTPQPAR